MALKARGPCVCGPGGVGVGVARRRCMPVAARHVVPSRSAPLLFALRVHHDERIANLKVAFAPEEKHLEQLQDPHGACDALHEVEVQQRQRDAVRRGPLGAAEVAKDDVQCTWRSHAHVQQPQQPWRARVTKADVRSREQQQARDHQLCHIVARPQHAVLGWRHAECGETRCCLCERLHIPACASVARVAPSPRQLVQSRPGGGYESDGGN